jgi:phospholipase/lecithinase/hemolysin
MQFRRIVLFAASVAIVQLAMTSIASAGSYSAVVAYGDSLSDNGNLFSLIGYPPAPYYNGRFSNEPVAVEQLATLLGAPLHDFAYGGATSGSANYIGAAFGVPGLPGMQTELAMTAGIIPVLAPGSLFVVWGGANDFLMSGSPIQAAANIDGIVASLKADGVKHILVPGMPDLGLTPDFFGDPVATAYAQAFNAAMLEGLPSGAKYVDTFNLMHDIFSNPAAFGLSNVTDPCFIGSSVCVNPNEYLFWDGFHPTTAADAILADEFGAAVTPEPSAILLMGTGALGLMLLVRRATA